MSRISILYAFEFVRTAEDNHISIYDMKKSLKSNAPKVKKKVERYRIDIDKTVRETVLLMRYISEEGIKNYEVIDI